MSLYDKDRDDAAPRMHSWPKPALNSAAQYQISGMPAVGTVLHAQTVSFERVTRAITVVTEHDNMTIDFGNTNQDPYPLIANIPQRFEILAVSMAVVDSDGGDASKGVNFAAELTGIQSDQCPDWDNTANVLFEVAAT